MASFWKKPPAYCCAVVIIVIILFGIEIDTKETNTYKAMHCQCKDHWQYIKCDQHSCPMCQPKISKMVNIHLAPKRTTQRSMWSVTLYKFISYQTENISLVFTYKNKDNIDYQIGQEMAWKIGSIKCLAQSDSLLDKADLLNVCVFLYSPLLLVHRSFLVQQPVSYNKHEQIAITEKCNVWIQPDCTSVTTYTIYWPRGLWSKYP